MRKNAFLITTVLLLAHPSFTNSQIESGNNPRRNSSQNLTQPTILWDISEMGLFDETNKAYPIKAGRVTVNLDKQGALCPTGLGHLATDRDTVKEIQFVFTTEKAGDYWLHIKWNPGGSGKEQFEAFGNGKTIGKSDLIDAQQKPNQWFNEKMKIELNKGQNSVMLRQLSGDGLRCKTIVLCESQKCPAALKPTLKYRTLEEYEQVINEPGIIMDSFYVRLYAPKKRAKEAKVIFPYLAKAYDELYKIVGVHTKYRMVVYHFPEKSGIKL